MSYIKQADEGEYIIVNFERLIESAAEWGRLNTFIGTDLVDIRDPVQSVNEWKPRWR